MGDRWQAEWSPSAKSERLKVDATTTPNAEVRARLRVTRGGSTPGAERQFWRGPRQVVGGDSITWGVSTMTVCVKTRGPDSPTISTVDVISYSPGGGGKMMKL
jgi:hypothetical protein